MIRLLLFALCILFAGSVCFGQWQALNGPPGGSVLDIEVDASGNIYSLFNNEVLYVSYDNGQNWSPRTASSGFNPTDILIDGDVMYGVNFSMFYKSEDFGETWQRVTNATQFTGMTRLLKHPTMNVLFAFGSGGIYVSSDNGLSWKQINTANIFDAVVSSTGDLFALHSSGVQKHAMPAAANDWSTAGFTLAHPLSGSSGDLAVVESDILALTQSAIVKGSNNGSSWSSIKTSDIVETNLSSPVWGIVPDGGAYIFSTTKVYYSDDGGAAWEAKTLPTAGYSNGSIRTVRFLSASVGLVGSSSDGLLRTIDGGLSWDLVGTNIHYFEGQDILLTASGRIMCTGSNGNYWYSDDQGSTWSHKRVFLTSTANFIKLPTDTLLAMGNSPMQYSVDNGDTWVVNASNQTLYDVTLNSAFTTDTYFGTGISRVARSTNGNNWTQMTITGLPASYTGYHIAQDNQGRLYVYLYNSSAGSYQIYKIEGITIGGTTGTATLLTIPFADNESTSFNLIGDLFVANNKLYVGTFNNIYISEDQGATWNTISFRKNSFFPIRKGSTTAIAAGTTGMLYTSQDDGKSWVGTSTPTSALTNYIQNVAMDSNGDYYAAGYRAPVFKFTDELVIPAASLPPYIDFNWQPTQGPHTASVSEMIIDNDGHAYTITGGTLYRTDPGFGPWQGSNPFSVSDLEYDPATNTLYGLTSARLYTSNDGGDTWDELNNENITGRRLLRRCPNGDVVFVSGASIYVSTDGGITFGASKYTAGGATISDIIIGSTGFIIAYLQHPGVTTSYSALYSEDRGATWNPFSLPAPSSEFTRLSADGHGNIYSSYPPISKSADMGQTWVPVTGNITHPYAASKVFVSPSDHLYIAASLDTAFSDLSILKSTDGGATWTKRSALPTSLITVSMIAWQEARMVLATPHGVFISDDDGATFALKTENIFASSFGSLEVLSSGGLITGTTTSAIFISNDFDHWEYKPDAPVRSFFRHPDGTLIGHSLTHLYRLVPGTQIWEEISTFPAFFSYVSTHDGSTYYAVGSDDLYVTSDLVTWTRVIVTGMPPSFFYTGVAVDHGGRVFALAVDRSSGLIECYRISFGSASKILDIETPRRLLTEGNKTYVYDATGRIFSTTDGSNWAIQPAPAGVDFLISSNGYYFITQNGGSLWLSRDGGQIWQSVGMSGLPSNARFFNVVVNESDGYAYATISNSVVRKSGNIVILPESDPPQITSLQPANGESNAPADLTLAITFNENVNPVAGKKIRIFDASNELTPLEIIDASAGTIQSKTISFSPATTFEYLKTYFVTVDNGAVKDIFGNSFDGISDENTWRFTIEDVPDQDAPAISYSHTTPTFSKGTANTLTVTVNDGVDGSGVNASSVKIYYRGITSAATPVTAVLTPGTESSFTIAVNDGWMDELGLEFKFEAKDLAGNTATLPADGSYFRGNIGFPTAQNPTLPSTLLTAGGQVSNYRIFSVPHQLADSKFSTVFDELSAQRVKTDYRILHFNTESDQYTEYPSMSTISRGVGYWVNIKNPPTISIDNASTPQNNKDQLFSMNLAPGWNQIGNPYPFPISWNAVRTAVGNDDIGVLKTFNGTGWMEDDIMNPFEGGFVFLDGTASVSVAVPFSAKSSSGRKKDATPSFKDGWMIPLLLEDGNFSTAGGVGMHPEAARGFDVYDDALPPKVFALPELAFPHKEHRLKQFSRDVVPPEETFVWHFNINAGEKQSIMKWDRSVVNSLGKEVYLFDVAAQRLIDMRIENQYTIPPVSAAPFRIFYNIPFANIKPSRVTLAKPYPNPLTDICILSFTLPENQSGTYDVSLDILDPLGRAVATIVRRALPSGFHTVEWQPEANSIPSSLYLVRLRVRNREGTVLLTEKIITKR